MRSSACAAGWPRHALGAVAGGQQDAELGGDRDHERAQRGGHRVQGDAQREEDERRPTGGQRDRDERDHRPLHPPVDREQDQEHRGEPGQQRERAAPRRGQPGVGLGGQHRQPGELRGHARGRVQLSAHLVDHGLLLVERHELDPEGEGGHRVVGRDHRLGEVGRHRVQQARDALPGQRAPLGLEEVGQRERGAQPGLPAPPLRGVAVALEQALLVAAHPARPRRARPGRSPGRGRRSRPTRPWIAGACRRRESPGGCAARAG